MSNSKNWLIAICVAVVVLILCLILDAILAGVLLGILILFQVPIAFEIAKWTVIVLFGLQLIVSLPFICAMFDEIEGGNKSGT